MSNKIFFDKLFPWKIGINRNNLRMSYDCVTYVTNCKDSAQISQLISKKMEKYNKKNKDITIIDATACVGGDTIPFCDHFGKVIPIEIDSERYENLVHNINVYGFKNAYPINDSCLSVIKDIQIPYHIIYLDCPWGGSEYKKNEKMELYLGDKNMCEVIDDFFKNSKSLKLVVSKLPKNYDYDKLHQKLKNYNVSIHKDMKKIDITFVERK